MNEGERENEAEKENEMMAQFQGSGIFFSLPAFCFFTSRITKHTQPLVTPDAIGTIALFYVL